MLRQGVDARTVSASHRPYASYTWPPRPPASSVADAARNYLKALDAEKGHTAFLSIIRSEKIVGMSSQAEKADRAGNQAQRAAKETPSVSSAVCRAI